MDKRETIRGTYFLKDGKPHLKVHFGTNPKPFDVALEEFLEDVAEGEGVQLTLERVKTGRTLYEEGNWNVLPAEEADPSYRFASPEAYERFLDMKFGMMVHWGIYSVLGTAESWPANAARDDLPSRYFLDVYYTQWQAFDPTEFDADEWADLAVRAGMQFFQVTTKHHDGFCMFDTKTRTRALKRQGFKGYPDQGGGVGRVVEVEMNYSIMDTRFGRDVVGELVAAFRKRGLGVGLYFSHIDWNDPNFRWDRANRSFDPEYGPDTHPEEWRAFIEREREQLRELLTNYGPIDQIFFDGTWFGLAWDDMVKIVHECRELQPHCMFSDRGLGPYGDFTSPERWIPESEGDKRLRGGKVWQVCDPIHTSWAYLPGDEYKPKDALLHNLVDAVAKGGTYVFAIAPMSNGRFPEKTVETLEWMGDWLHRNGEAIYYTRKWDRAKDPERDVYFTRSKDGRNVYAIHFGVPEGTVEVSGLTPREGAKVVLLGTMDELDWSREGDCLKIDVPPVVREKVKDEVAVAFCVPVELPGR
ncbi:MAG: alpha-L-fucosidase [Promethearchaeota archaeon]